MRILVVCQHYFPENFQITPICEQLVADGFDVTVLTGLPNYPTGIVPDEYKNGHRDEWINGVHLIRGYEVGRKKGIIWRILNYLSYMTSASLCAMKNLGEFDIVLAYQLSPVLMAVPGIVVKRRKNIPMFLYCCDLWPESMKMMIKNENSLPFKIMLHVSRWIYSQCDKISVQSKSFFKYFEEVDRIEREKLCYIPQFASSEYLTINEHQQNSTVDFVFLGNIGIAQDIGMIIDAIDRIRDVPGFMMHFVGDGSYLETAKTLVREKKLEHLVRFHGRKPVSDMPEYYSLADVCVVTLKAGSIVSHTVPSKVQGYMSAGKPILAALNGYGADVIKEADCGICVPAGDTEAFAAAMKEFVINPEAYAHCGECSREYFKKYFTQRVVVDAIEEQLEKLTAQ